MKTKEEIASKQISLYLKGRKDDPANELHKRFIRAMELYHKENMNKLKIYRVEFEGVWPVGNCLILAAFNQEQAEEMASKTIQHTDKFVVNELCITEPQIIEYLSGDY